MVKESRPVGVVSVRLDVSAAVHQQLRVLAAMAGLPMSQFVRKLVEDAVSAATGQPVVPVPKQKTGRPRKGPGVASDGTDAQPAQQAGEGGAGAQKKARKRGKGK
jgi:hypothetical protein